MSSRAYSASESDASECAENSYCIFLHLVEGIGLIRKDTIGDFSERHKDKIILNASLNGVKFEVEGHSTETATIFNSNCIWECELGDIKRMKTDNRPVKVECFVKSGRSENSPRHSIGSLLLPIRGVQTVAALRNVQLKLHWHKLGALSPEWRVHKPEIYLLLIIVKKTLIDNGQFEAFLGKKKYLANDGLSPNISETSLMLQSQSNVYVQLLEQVGLIQVGNNPDMDCDIFNVTLTFKQVKNLTKMLELERVYSRQTNVLIFHYDFLGSASQLEMSVNANDCYAINEKISLSFKSSLKSLRNYFQRIFYIPINLYLNGVAIANYRFDFSKMLPDDLYFNMHKNWTKNGTFTFDRLHKILSPRALKPSVDFIFSIQLVTSYSKKNNFDLMTLSETFVPYKIDEKAAGDTVECYRNLDYPHGVHLHRRAPYDNCLLGNRHLNNFEMYEKHYIKAQADPLLIGRALEDKDDLYAKSSEEFIKETSTEKEDAVRNSARQRINKRVNSVCVGTEDLANENKESSSKEKEEEDRKSVQSIAINTDPLETVQNTAPDADELTLKIVQELEEWKAQQMEHFLKELARKETNYLAALDKKWEQQRAILQARLEAKLASCEQLNTKLECAQIEMKANVNKNKETINIVETVKRDIERSYADKFQQLDQEMHRLKLEVQQRMLESSRREVEQNNKHLDVSKKLEEEKMALKGRIEQLEKQLEAVEKTHFSAEQLQEMLADLRKQTERFADMEKSKNYYKDQWTKTTKELHKLKLCMLKKQEEQFNSNKKADLEINLEEILDEEQEALKSDRSELKSIKHILFDSSDSSSVGEFNVE